MAHENESIHGTFHLKLNLTITGEFEDLETICDDEFPFEHDALVCASNLLQVTVGWVIPKKRQTIKQHLEMIHKRFPTNLNVTANLISLYNSLLLVKKSAELFTKLLELTEGNFPLVNLRKSQALAERAYVLVGDVASQEKIDDIEKLKVAINWFEMAIELGQPNGMPEDECFIWKFFLAKTRYRLENRYRSEDNQTADRSNNIVEMLTRFAEIYEEPGQQHPAQIERTPESARESETAGNRTRTVIYSREQVASEVCDLYSYLKALALAYLAEVFSIMNAPDKNKKLCVWNKIPQSFKCNTTLQHCHTDPSKAYEEASKLSDNYKIKNRFARSFMIWGPKYFEKALRVVFQSIDSTKKTKGNWFGYATCLQIYCKQYLFSLKQAKKCTNLQERRYSFQDAKSILRKALEYVDDCPYRSASTLLDIADIYYYLGVDPDTEEKTVIGETDLEKSLEYLMMARERVEGYKNPRTHARLAHCLWALGSWRPAIECMKLAIGMERPGYKNNFINLCKYVEKSRNITAKEKAAIYEFGKERYKDVMEVRNYLAGLEIYFREASSSSDNSWQDYKEPPSNAKNDGYTYDFFILNADKDNEFAAILLNRLEHHSSYKGFFYDRDIQPGQSKLGLDRVLQTTKKIIIILTSEFLVDKTCVMIMADIICCFRDNVLMHRSSTDVNKSANIIPIMLEKDCYLPYGASLLTQPLVVSTTTNKLSDADFLRLTREIDRNITN